MSKYPCNQCGICCMNLHKHEIYQFLHNGNGICFHYMQEEKKCSIYENRPIICDIERYYQNFIETMNFEEYFNLNVLNCQSLQKSRNLPVINL